MWKRKLLALLILIAAPLMIAGDCEYEDESDDCLFLCFDD